jgi:glycosyltransferase involved in cell wall biosynthesis
MDKIKVFIDKGPLKNESAFRGVGEYTRNLIEALGKQGNLELVGADKNPDIVHYPYFDLFFLTLPFSKKCPTVVTIHDVIPLIFPKHYPPGIRGSLKFQLQKLSLKSVSAVITDSENSKKDIIKYLGCPKEKVFVIPLAPARGFKQSAFSIQHSAIREKYLLPEHFVLYVGDVNYNKNILGLVEACKKINIPLVIVGKQARQEDFNREHIENQPLVQLIEEYGDEPLVKRIGFIPTNDLVTIYNLATVYCQPSFYEGFGLPILQAMACGCPVVAANTGSLPEICGNAAIMVNPNDIKSIAGGLREVVENEDLRRDLIKKGLNQVKKFSWEKTAEETIRVYERVLEKE